MAERETALQGLAAEYRKIGDQLADLRRFAGESFVATPAVLRLQAREMEIVDCIAAAGLAPDVLLKA